MCGVTGALIHDRHSLEAQRAFVEAMNEELFHRGPDGEGLWTSNRTRGKFSGVVLGHRRLAVIDTSETGAQPMISRDGRWVLSYNGEVYNSENVRRALGLAAGDMRGHSDTEVLLAAISAWGVEDTLRAVDGMFAFAVWDNHQSELWLARDAFGEKPLYFSAGQSHFVFASELRSLCTHPDVETSLDPFAVSEFFRWGWVPSPMSIFRGVQKLEPGSFLRVRLDGSKNEQIKFWDLAAELNDAAIESTGTFRELLSASVQSRMRSDVPLGAFLSGGLDSSAVVALMQENSDQPVRTFTIGFDNQSYDESGYAAEVARYLGTDHQTLRLSPKQALELVPELPNTYSEPFADSSQLPTLMLCRMARESVTVALSGDGGDELLGGYDRYRFLDWLSRRSKAIPAPLRWLAGSPAGSLAAASVALPGLRSIAKRMTPEGIKVDSGRLRRALEMVAMTDETERYRRVMRNGPACESIVLEAKEPMAHDLSGPGGMSAVQQAILSDIRWYLPEDLMTKVDRASMSVSLEVRAPMLNRDLFLSVWARKESAAVITDPPKRELRTLLSEFLPPRLIDRPKMGFGVPVGDWVKGPLQDWAEDLLSRDNLAASGVLDVEAARKVWLDHRDHQADHGALVWALVMFQAWIGRQR